MQLLTQQSFSNYIAALIVAVLLSLMPAATSYAQSGAAPYDERLSRLSEVLGSIHYLRNLCGDASNDWREQMETLLNHLPIGDETDRDAYFDYLIKNKLTGATIPTITEVPPTCTADGTSTISNYNSSNTYVFTPAGPTIGAGGLINGMTLGTSYTVTATSGSCTSSASSSFTNLAMV